MLGSVRIYPRPHAKENIHSDKYITKWGTDSHMGILTFTNSKFGYPYIT